MATMRKGEISKFIFSPAYAYREMGCPPRIPPDTSGKQ
jgi:FK506-binding protein 6